MGARHRAATLYSVGPPGARTMKQPCASAAKLRGGGPILITAWKPGSYAGHHHLGRLPTTYRASAAGRRNARPGQRRHRRRPRRGGRVAEPTARGALPADLPGRVPASPTGALMTRTAPDHLEGWKLITTGSSSMAPPARAQPGSQQDCCLSWLTDSPATIR